MKNVFVIGAGASGLLAAITAARNGAAVTILEGMEKPGKKLLTTGNGKCNITNTDMSDPNVFRSSDPEFVKQILEQFGVSDTLAFLKTWDCCSKTAAAIFILTWNRHRLF